MSTTTFFKLSVITVSLSTITSSHAAQKQFLRDQLSHQSLPTFTQSITPTQSLGLGINDGLVIRKQYLSSNGDTTIRYQQTYQGILKFTSGLMLF